MKEVPSENWTLDKLRTFCQRVGRRAVVDAWRIGRACLIARTKVTGRWLDWVNEIFGQGSYPTINRYMHVAENLGIEDLEGKSLTELYFDLGIKRRGKPEPEPNGEKSTGEVIVIEPGEDVANVVRRTIPFHLEKFVELVEMVKRSPAKTRKDVLRENPVDLDEVREAVNWLEAQMR